MDDGHDKEIALQSLMEVGRALYVELYPGPRGAQLATLFNFEIKRLTDKSLTEIEQNVNWKRKAPEERGVG